MLSVPSQPFWSNHLTWTVSRTQRTFAVRVVEPHAYEPKNHAKIFTQIINELINPKQTKVLGQNLGKHIEPDCFDLLVFPEAFAPLDALLETLQLCANIKLPGCIHVGLRSSKIQDLPNDNHLITYEELLGFVRKLGKIDNLAQEDLDAFKEWLERQDERGYFNIGCLFTHDADGQMRICLHPKVVRSKFEISTQSNCTMTEGDLLTLVTLQPSNKKFLSLTIQPLICADCLFTLSSDRGTQSPLRELKNHIKIFTSPPDHIDIVSVVTCTPQMKVLCPKSGFDREWHNDFRDTFVRASQDDEMSRHLRASFVLANFRTLPDDVVGGLSGIFEPTKPNPNFKSKSVALSCYGRPNKNYNNSWSEPDSHPLSEWDVRGYIAALDFEAIDPAAVASVFGFTLNSLLRDAPQWKSEPRMRNCHIRVARWTEADSLELTPIGDSR